MAFSLLTHVSKQATGSGGTGNTTAIDTTGASLLVAASGFLSSGASATALPTVTDNQTNLWAPYVVEGQVTAANTGAVVIYVCFNPTTNASHTFAAANGFCSIAVAAFSGGDIDFPFGVWNRNALATTTSLGTGSITPPVDNCLLIAALGYRQTTTVSIDSSFTIVEQQAFIAGTSIGVALAYLIQGTAAAVNPIFSWTGSSSFASTGIMAIRTPPSSPAAGVPRGIPFVGALA